MGRAIIAGLDEAGRGALAGPVVAAACVFEKAGRLPRGVCIADSKEMRSEERERAFAFLSERVPFGVGIVEAALVDTLGILGATERAMQRAVAHLARRKQPTYLLIDGRDTFWFDLPHSSIVHGDALEPCISAASIIAKVIRDRIMVRSDRVFPGYAFAAHKGYGTLRHRERIGVQGLSPLHRRTFLATL